MNERIKELAEQAGIVFWEISGDVDWRQANRETLEKFAELIVEECVQAVLRTNKTHVYTTYDVTLVETTISKSVNSIKQHFNLEKQ